MRAFRSVLLRRLIAAALVAGLGAPLVPTASAQGGIESVLDDERAFDAALRAAWAADADPLAAFAAAYSEATDGAVTADVVERLLGAASMSGVPPAVADETFANAKRAVAIGGALVVGTASLSSVPEAAHARATGPAEVVGAPVPNESRPRAP